MFNLKKKKCRFGENFEGEDKNVKFRFAIKAGAPETRLKSSINNIVWSPHLHNEHETRNHDRHIDS